MLRRRPLGLLIGVTASAILLGCQRFVPLAMNTPENVDTYAFRPLVQPPLPAVQADLALMPAAVPTGEFERMDPPTPAPAVAAPESESAPAEAESEAEAAPDEDSGTFFESGIASTYGVGDGFQGNRTACGQRFNTHVPQVAHKTLPCGTMLRVEDADSGKSVVVQVTDRGPYVRGRVVDLSWAAFSELYTQPDLLHVNVYVLGQ